MKPNNKTLWTLLLMITVVLLAACGNKTSSDAPSEGKVSVVTSFYPLFFFAQQIGGEHAQVVNLIAAGVEPHDWTPKSRDLETASNAQLFLYNGAGLEGWVDDFLKGLGSGNRLLTVEASKGIELIRGNPEHAHEHEGEAQAGEHEGEAHADEHEGEAQADEHEGEAHADEHEGEAQADEHEGEAHADEHVGEEDGHNHSDLDVDPHTWTSPRSALVMAANIRDAYIQVDPEHRADYEAHYATLEEKLKQLDAKFTQELAAFERRDIVVSHQAFGYLCRDYGLNQIAIMGLSPEAEPRAQDLLEIAKYVKEHDIPYIFFEELVSQQLADTLAREAKVDTLVLNPLEGLTVEQERAGEDYFSIMESNLENLRKALG